MSKKLVIEVVMLLLQRCKLMQAVLNHLSRSSRQPEQSRLRCCRFRPVIGNFVELQRSHI